ncbi:MAG TPA: DUF1697 domain-containing protein [Blastocatellia bacterium]|nr:DUF1697 domain-containing protein [Blastocatellia bacterium]
MAALVSLLRGINLGPNKRVRMEDLKNIYESLGLRKVTTYVQSGNVVFECGKSDPARIAKKIEDAVAKNLRVESRVIIRSADELRGVIKRNPIALDASRNPRQLQVFFLDEQPDRKAIDSIPNLYSGTEEIEVIDKECYVYYFDGIGRSKLNVERLLKVVGTARNWNTVMRLAELAAQIEK